jgi:2-succinyl-6-hydroxy-2,4-cyclohexadiene-1-carboxylate synthase
MNLPLVFLHGFLGTKRDWEPVISHLPPCECICLDLPGHGNAPFSKTFDLAVPAPKFHLIGYSMGGRLAMQYALLHPNRIASLTLASTHPGLSSLAERKERLASDAAWAKRLFDDDFFTAWYEQPLFAGFKPKTPRSQNRKELAASLLHYSLGAYPPLNVPGALHIVGEKDLKFRALHPTALVIEGAGHMVHLEKPKEFAKILDSYIILPL